ncbi:MULTISPECIES: 6-carboxytetrahydropterin synthase [unclassified Thioalkalivibrio]|uniref:6-pyruvoyl trahydropterin synthase family protein n=1 Tax=unclassified Thioalkalivibrio TaxID=2621013 RepID=UPI000372A758|nr:MULTISPECIES: 6-carboxytetrahydropterin synthase [unclassified Thioalkalivibrio]
MYSLNVRDHFMIAHSFAGETFGPAQKLHGATYVVDVTFRRRALDADGLVVDIGRASEVVKALLADLNYQNLDEREEFRGQNTTTEFLAHALHQRVASAIHAGELGESARELDTVCVTLNESHIAWASYEAAP